MAPWTFSLTRCETSQTFSLSHRYNVLIVSHEITRSNRQTLFTGLNKQTPIMGQNKLPHQCQNLTLIPFVTTRTQLYRYYILKVEKDHHDLKIRLLSK